MVDSKSMMPGRTALMMAANALPSLKELVHALEPLPMETPSFSASAVAHSRRPLTPPAFSLASESTLSPLFSESS